MKLEPKSIEACPNCKTSIDKADKHGDQRICGECGERWSASDIGWWLKQYVRVNKPGTCFHDCVGEIEQIVSPTTVRVRFRLTKREVHGDIFHPHYLELAQAPDVVYL